MLIFDFDGTVSLGIGPVLAYARCVATALGARSSDPDTAAMCVAAVERGLLSADETGVAPGGLAPVDGYDLVRLIASSYGATATELADGYRASRELLATSAAPVTAPQGFAEFLSEARAERILLTNAPNIRITAALEELGLSGVFDTVITDAGKPLGMGTLLDSFGPNADGAARPVLSIGDVWANDLEPAQRRGHATALVGSVQTAGATPDLRGDSVTALLPALRAWLDDPSRPPVPDPAS